VPASTRRSMGTFFSGRELAARLVEPYSDMIGNGGIVIDPACGVGDLLLAAAEHLPMQKTLKGSAGAWNRQLIGLEIDPAFARVARARLLLALRRKTPFSRVTLIADDAFSQIQTSDSLSSPLNSANASLLLLNPPFGTMAAPVGCTWGSGLVARAAVFAESVVRSMSLDTRIALILPDVLRSGARYENWRNAMSRLMKTESIDVVGRFDRWTDVDIFILRGIRKTLQAPVHVKPTRKSVKPTVSNAFAVSVGPVVPHRDAEAGPERAFLHAKGLPRFTTVTTIEDRRQYCGSVTASPFVVIRRTSRPGDGMVRAIATLIAVSEPVAVENHLIVARPHDGTIDTCKRLLKLLKSQKTTNWLNRQTRCRHLSVRFIKAIPWAEDD
jgi:hypothetical protein